jgi:mRNA-degrading endonuclease RelE of RelBE toxin-antitoxin system
MTAGFQVLAPPSFGRALEALTKRHPELVDLYAQALSVLREDPFNVSRTHAIKKLHGVPEGEGQYRLRLRRFRIRYDVVAREVVLLDVSLRREDTYRQARSRGRFTPNRRRQR